MAPHSSTLAWKTRGQRAWWAVVHGVTKSWTRLSDFTFTFTWRKYGQGNQDLMDERKRCATRAATERRAGCRAKGDGGRAGTESLAGLELHTQWEPHRGRARRVGSSEAAGAHSYLPPPHPGHLGAAGTPSRSHSPTGAHSPAREPDGCPTGLYTEG